ncbi:hypothetical protein M885DRAFT_523950 [Pelagophyceae sp. CCMP2097]|nr:hypothetical protein M885DRAFT_523950 [Pelagophyceae sp. CCMP2097]
MSRRLLVYCAAALAALYLCREYAGARAGAREALEATYEATSVLAKELELAHLDLAASRATHERDMRSTAVAAAAATLRQAHEDEVAWQHQQAHEATAAATPPPPPPAAPRDAPPIAPRAAPPPVVERRALLPEAAPTGPLNARPYLRDASSTAPRRVINVVVYNKIKGYLDWLRPDFVDAAKTQCSTECRFSEGRGPKQLASAHGIVFHAKTHSKNDFPKSKPPKAKYLLVSLEQENYAPLLKDATYVSRFDWTMTYNLDSTLPMITIHPHWDSDAYFAHHHVPWEHKRNAVAAFVSNCKNAGAEKRLALLGEVSKHVEVHSYGKCLHNTDEPPSPAGENRGDAKRRILANYKFYLAFENAIVGDYVSEKVYDGLLAGSLPIYLGAKRVDRLTPAPEAVIKFSDFGDDPRQLAAYLKMLQTNKTAYEKHFAWKEPPRNSPDAQAKFQTVLDMTAYKFTALCRICHGLAEETPE